VKCGQRIQAKLVYGAIIQIARIGVEQNSNAFGVEHVATPMLLQLEI
jgi:hypothetical protein